jgi:multidrug efflux pump subunit AcrA (membrane-fusion protein)
MKFNLRINPSRKNRALAIVAIVGLATTGTLMATAPEHDASEVEEKAWPVTTMALESETLAPELRLFGRVETPRHANLTAAVTATVNAINVSEGDLVEKGQILLALDDADEDLRYQQRAADATEARAALETTRRELEVNRQVLQHMQELHELTVSKRHRLDKLEQQNLVATEQLEDTRALVARQAIQLAQQQLKVDSHPERMAVAEAAFERAQALLEEQELRLSRTLVVAPFRGRISSIAAAPGDRVREGEVLLSIYDTAALQVRVTLPSSAVMPIKQAIARHQLVQATLGGQEGYALDLHQLAAEVANGRSGVDGLFDIRGDGDGLELGKAVDVTVVMPALEQVASIPVQSLYGDDRIYAIVDGRLQGVEVDTLGQRRDQSGQVELLVRASQQELPDEILTTSLPQASTGLRVNIING